LTPAVRADKKNERSFYLSISTAAAVRQPARMSTATPPFEVSRTAQYMALFRALEAGRAPQRRLFDDHLARHFLSGPLRTAGGLARLPPARAGIEAVIDRRWPGARTSAVARTRLIDDWTRGAVAAGATQLVILGAGFDARAYRLAELGSLRVFEVDRPEVVARKREVAGRIDPAHAPTYLELDFDREDVPSALRAAGLDPAQTTCVIWEGVTHYLSAAAVVTTLEAVASSVPAGSRLLFTYVHRGVIDGSVAFDAAQAALAAVNRAGEPWRFGLAPNEVEPFLARAGYRLVEDVSSREYRERYLPAKARYLRGFEFYRAARAEVTTPDGTEERHCQR
jgi:methyltransferase (TIGR00027 family)